MLFVSKRAQRMKIKLIYSNKVKQKISSLIVRLTHPRNSPKRKRKSEPIYSKLIYKFNLIRVRNVQQICSLLSTKTTRNLNMKLRIHSKSSSTLKTRKSVLKMVYMYPVRMLWIYWNSWTRLTQLFSHSSPWRMNLTFLWISKQKKLKKSRHIRSCKLRKYLIA